MHDWSHWDQLAERYQTRRPRRMLALDGGGIRGLIAVKALTRLESLLAEAYAKTTGRARSVPPVSILRLCGRNQHGSIYRGRTRLRMSEIGDFYRDFGRIAFTWRQWYYQWKSFLAKRLG